MTIRVHFDGLCEPNPGGVCTYGFTIEADGGPSLEEYGVLRESGTPAATNNLAEWTALVRALERLVELGQTDEPVVVRGDSELVIRQVRGEYRVRKRTLRPLAETAAALALRFRDIRFEWVPREQNQRADALCRIAGREARRRGRRGR